MRKAQRLPTRTAKVPIPASALIRCALAQKVVLARSPSVLRTRPTASIGCPRPDRACKYVNPPVCRGRDSRSAGTCGTVAFPVATNLFFQAQLDNWAERERERGGGAIRFPHELTRKISGVKRRDGVGSMAGSPTFSASAFHSTQSVPTRGIEPFTAI